MYTSARLVLSLICSLTAVLAYVRHHELRFSTSVEYEDPENFSGRDEQNIDESIFRGHVYQAEQTHATQHVSDNSTLGFSKIVVLNLQTRSDRKDEMVLMGEASGLDLTFVEATDGSKILDKRFFPAHESDVKHTELACWRSHANIWRMILEQKLETVLVLEDDVDWNIKIRQQLRPLEGPLNMLNDADVSRNARMDYDSRDRDGRSWDFINLGSCVEDPWPSHSDGDRLPFTVYEDETAPDYQETSRKHQLVLEEYDVPQIGSPRPQSHETDTASGFNSSQRWRLVQKSNRALCTVAYAITRRGAAKLLYHSTRSLNGPVDIVIAEAAHSGYLKSFSVVPPLMAQWKLPASMRNSDIIRLKPSLWSFWGPKRSSNDFVSPSVGYSLNVGTGSVRRNLAALLSGGGRLHF